MRVPALALAPPELVVDRLLLNPSLSLELHQDSVLVRSLGVGLGMGVSYGLLLVMELLLLLLLLLVMLNSQELGMVRLRLVKPARS